MRALGCAITVLVIALAFPIARAAESGWRLEKDKEGIQVYTRAVDGWSIREFKGVCLISASLSSIVAVIDDTAASHELSDLVSESRIQHRDSDTHFQIYSAMKLPWPMSDRDILNQRDITQDQHSLVVTITDVAEEDAIAPRKGYIRIVKSRTQWTLTPTAEGTVLAETRTLSDPDGPIPVSVINAMSVSTPFKTLSKLRQIVRRDEYQRAKLPFILESVARQ
jgi:hypothetical protein